MWRAVNPNFPKCGGLEVVRFHFCNSSMAKALLIMIISVKWVAEKKSNFSDVVIAMT